MGVWKSMNKAYLDLRKWFMPSYTIFLAYSNRLHGDSYQSKLFIAYFSKYHNHARE
jgi:hypothetical protein